MIAEPHTDFHLVAVIHLEYLVFFACDLTGLELLLTVPFRQKRVADVLHRVYSHQDTYKGKALEYVFSFDLTLS